MWGSVDLLILSQVVYQHISKTETTKTPDTLTEEDWKDICLTFQSQFLISKNADLVDELGEYEICKTKYLELIENTDFSNVNNVKVQLPVHAKLVRSLHISRINELKELLNQNQLEFNKTLNEIEEIRQGKWDEQLQSEPSTTTPSTPISHSKPPLTPSTRIAKNQKREISNDETNMDGDDELEEFENPEQSVDSPVVVERKLDIKKKKKDLKVVVGDIDGDGEESGMRKKRKVEEYETDPENSDSQKKASTSKKSNAGSSSWKKTALMIWNKIADHKYGNVFMNAIKEADAPGYNSIIKQPMSLNIIKKRINDGEIQTTQELHRDLMLMFSNCLMFNPENSDICDMAHSIRQFADQEMRNLVYFETRRSSVTPTTPTHDNTEVIPGSATSEQVDTPTRSESPTKKIGRPRGRPSKAK
ncbi:Bromodomain-containing protein 8 [Nowakowskiella sp. JEL0407]|nr:Bromodomain-containing protein 8 [Nowakowskiella sp. JEL0407]